MASRSWKWWHMINAHGCAKSKTPIFVLVKLAPCLSSPHISFSWSLLQLSSQLMVRWIMPLDKTPRWKALIESQIHERLSHDTLRLYSRAWGKLGLVKELLTTLSWDPMNCHDVLNGLGRINLTLLFWGFVYLLACVYFVAQLSFL